MATVLISIPYCKSRVADLDARLSPGGHASRDPYRFARELVGMA